MGEIIQLTGLPGAGKTTLACMARDLLEPNGLPVKIIDGDTYRKTLCRDLGFSENDRKENIRRLGKEASHYSNNRIVIIAAINPYHIIREELRNLYDAKVVWLKCALDILIHRDKKDLYRRALLPEDHPERINNLTGVNDPYEEPYDADLIIDTGILPIEQSVKDLKEFILLLVHGKAFSLQANGIS